jgi:putative oxygen-independent coproporphyrinogen III oxidase
MPSVMPEGQPAPRDSSLPEQARSELPQRPLGIYIHVPFCTTRCGYCDFNTYTPAELGSEPGASRTGYIDAAIQELGIAARVLGPDAPPVSTIFVGGGTPTVLPPDDLGRLVAAVRSHFGLAPDAEVTTESNPESIDFAGLQRLRELGFNRISFGMQSAVPQVLATLDRTHTPGRPIQAVTDAKAAGFANISLDLIYGTPGESASDWLESLEAALSAAPQHISAYALIVEDGTRLAARIRRGELPPTDEDDLADTYLIADDRFTAAGYRAYEVSNWSRSAATRCRHNLGYWRSHHWWGVGPGAHSHVGGVRWWNLKHPQAYASRLASGLSPAQARELLSAEQRRTERILLELRLADGLSTSLLTATEKGRLVHLVAQRLAVIEDGMLILTRDGRLLADGVIRDLLD